MGKGSLFFFYYFLFHCIYMFIIPINFFITSIAITKKIEEKKQSTKKNTNSIIKHPEE